MIRDASLFSSLTIKYGGHITIRDNAKEEIIKHGNIGMPSSSIMIDIVTLIVGLKHNLIRYSQLYDIGYETSFNSCCIIRDSKSGKTLLIGNKWENVDIINIVSNE